MRKFYITLLLSSFTLLPFNVISSSSLPKTYAHSGKLIYLTIDMDMSQGMSTKLKLHKASAWYDPQLINYLKDNHIPATFFVSGLFAETYHELIKDLNATGNYSFENHSYDESGFTPHCYRLHTLTTDKEKIDQINKTQRILNQLTDRSPVYFRFPGLCHMSSDDQLLRQLGLEINEGDIVVGDPFNRNTQTMVKHTLKQAADGRVIIMHVGGPNAPHSLDVLKQIIPNLQQQGYAISRL